MPPPLPTPPSSCRRRAFLFLPALALFLFLLLRGVLFDRASSSSSSLFSRPPDGLLRHLLPSYAARHPTSFATHNATVARARRRQIRDAMAAYRAARARCVWQPRPLASGLGAASSSSSSSLPGDDAAPADLCYRATNSTRAWLQQYADGDYVWSGQCSRDSAAEMRVEGCEVVLETDPDRGGEPAVGWSIERLGPFRSHGNASVGGDGQDWHTFKLVGVGGASLERRVRETPGGVFITADMMAPVRVVRGRRGGSGRGKRMHGGSRGESDDGDGDGGGDGDGELIGFPPLHLHHVHLGPSDDWATVPTEYSHPFPFTKGPSEGLKTTSKVHYLAHY